MKRCSCPLLQLVSIHPVAIIRVFVRIDIRPSLSKMNLVVLLAHVYLELARGPAALPAVIAVAHAEEVLAAGKGESPAWGNLM